MQVNFSLMSSLTTHQPTLHFTLLVTLTVHPCAISTSHRAYSTAAISEQCTTPERSEAFEGEVPCPKTQHRNNVPNLHQAGLKTAQQAATLAKLDSLALMQTFRCSPNSDWFSPCMHTIF